MAKEDIEINRKKLLEFLVALRDVTLETKYHIYDVSLDPLKERQRKSQVMAAAIVSEDEILKSDFSALKDFTDNLHTLRDPTHMLSRFVHHDRVAVAMNASEKYFYEHGECRIFDPHKKHLFKIIDDEVLLKTGRYPTRQKFKTFDKAGFGVFENMENKYVQAFGELTNAVILVYSFYIPCSIDFHDCAKVLRKFVHESGHNMVVGFDHLYRLTDEKISFKWLNTENIIVLNNTEMKREIRRQTMPLIRNISDNKVYKRSDVYNHYDRFNDMLAEFSDDSDDTKETRHVKLVRKRLCRQIMKEYNMMLR